ncbi:ATP-binding protein [Streptomyces sp. bgisy032]|uniref:ATP-binding protein n=1 Tax=Streptomyces sp. bgisy032 TaxID=3413773 RepID=UPI003D7100CC
MVIPLMKQADEQGGNERAALHFSAAWAEGAVCPVEARLALSAFLSHAPHTGRTPVPPPLFLDAQLVVSELVTNAVRHAPGPCGMNLRLARDELAITVWDTSTRTPVLRHSDGHGIGGHGMRVVHLVSRSVDVALGAHGKQVTARLSLPAHDGARTADRTAPAGPRADDPPRPAAHEGH